MIAKDLLLDLVSYPSVSRVSNREVSDWVLEQFARLDMTTEETSYTDAAGHEKVNVVGKLGDGEGGLGYFCHTDVVPADDWNPAYGSPFEPTEQDERIYGRGSCDMKGSLACFLAATESIDPSRLKSPIYITCTADEEIGYLGATHLARHSEFFREMVQTGIKGIVGEPTELEVVHAHKGYVIIRTTSHGRSAHSSTNEGLNANLAMIPFLNDMKSLYDETMRDPRWHDERFAPHHLGWNIGINDFTHATNITPAKSVCTVSFRPMPGMDCEPLIERIHDSANRNGLTSEIGYNVRPLYMNPKSRFVGDLLELVGRDESPTVGYGTDGAVLQELKELVIWGPGSIAQAHTNNEWITLEQLEKGTKLYRAAIEKWCC